MEVVQSVVSLLMRNLLGNLALVALIGAFYLVSHMANLRAKRGGLDANHVDDLSFWIGVGALVGGRLGYTLPSLSSYLAHPIDLIRINSGLDFYGALVGGLSVAALGTRRRRMPFWSVADNYGLYAPLGIAITRFACLLRNTCYGVKAPPPLGIVFPGLTQSRYPSELYEGLLALLVFGGLLWLSEGRLRSGGLFLGFVVGYPLARAVVDLTRVDLGSQWGAAYPILSVAVAMLAATALWFRQRAAESLTIAVSEQELGSSEVPR